MPIEMFHEGGNVVRLEIGGRLTRAEFARSARIPANTEGVRVSDVERAGASAGKLFPNDIITEVRFPGPRRAVKSVADLQEALRTLKSGDIVSLMVFNVVPPQSTRVVNIQIP